MVKNPSIEQQLTDIKLVDSEQQQKKGSRMQTKKRILSHECLYFYRCFLPKKMDILKIEMFKIRAKRQKTKKTICVSLY